jgi:hypothetical protein
MAWSHRFYVVFFCLSFYHYISFCSDLIVFCVCLCYVAAMGRPPPRKPIWRNPHVRHINPFAVPRRTKYTHPILEAVTDATGANIAYVKLNIVIGELRHQCFGCGQRQSGNEHLLIEGFTVCCCCHLDIIKSLH